MPLLDKMIDSSSWDEIRRWESPSRLYEAWLARDLLGDLVLVTQWAGKDSHRGGSKIRLVQDIQDGLRQMQNLARRRKAHGYEVVS